MLMDEKVRKLKLQNIKEKALKAYLIERKSELISKLKSNEHSIDDELKKLDVESEKFSDADAMKVKQKISECERNVNFISREIKSVNMAQKDLECGKNETDVVNREYANLEMSNIKREMNIILGWAVVIYLITSISLALFNMVISDTTPTHTLFEMFFTVTNITLTGGMILISIALVSVYDKKCENYNSVVEKMDVSLKITDSSIKDNKPGIFKWYALILCIIFFVQSLIVFMGEIIITIF